jgi:hypothetical protein
MINLLSLLIWLSAALAQDNLRCVNFYGLETERKDFVCSWVNPPGFYIDQLVRRLGVNTLRIPFSHEYVNDGDWSKLDAVVKLCDVNNINIIFDFHRVFATHQSPAPDAEISLDQFLTSWTKVLDRYKGHSSAYGVSIFNEIHSSDWDYVNGVSLKIVNHLEKLYPERFYYFIGGGEWGSDVSGLTLEGIVPINRSRVEVHIYKWHGNGHRVWNHRIPIEHHQRVFIGETGWKREEQQPWAQRWLQYLSDMNIYDFCFWTIAHSGDTGGLWLDDCTTPEEDKFRLLFDYWEGKL